MSLVIWICLRMNFHSKETREKKKNHFYLLDFIQEYLYEFTDYYVSLIDFVAIFIRLYVRFVFWSI